jgi:protocatechuate 3,4-dioxygenase beta subunit
MHTDDRPVGRVLSRREVVGLLGLSAGALLVGGAGAQPAPTCVVRPQQTEGPFFVDERLNRSDIRSEPTTAAVKAGVPLQVAFKVSRLAGAACTPLGGAQVDVWHCDALGAYSDTPQKFLRGYQVTDPAGLARFTTIYPGWYPGRAVHIHFKIRTDPEAEAGFEFTSQLFFDDELSRAVYATGVYAQKGPQDQPNANDGIFNQSGGATLLSVTQEGDGYRAIFPIAVQLT